MNKEDRKKLTFEQLVAAKLQRDKDKLKITPIYIPSLGGTLTFKHVPDERILEILDGLKGDRTSSYEMSTKLIYESCVELQDPKLHDELGIKDPYSIVPALFSIYEINNVGTELLEIMGAAERTEEIATEIKN